MHNKKRRPLGTQGTKALENMRKNLDWARQELGLTWREVSILTGVTETSLWKTANAYPAHENPTISLVLLMCEAVKVKPTDVFLPHGRFKDAWVS